MKQLAILIPVLFFSFSTLFAQINITGVVRDKQSGLTVQSATVTLQNVSDTTYKRSVLTDTSGRFRFVVLEPDTFRISFSTIGYGSATTGLRVDTADVDLGTVDLVIEAGVLAGVTVTASIAPVTQKQDTVQYNANQFKVNPDATVEDLARKMPGITIEGGQVKAQGENVQRVTIDGREFFGDDATAALRNLPAEIVDKIQVFDRLSDQAQFTGIDDGNTTKGINIVTKANMRNGQFGRVFAGYGTDGRYHAGGNTTFLNGNRKISLVGNFNNINQQNFGQQDLLGVTSSARGGGRGGGGGGRGGGGPRGGGGGGGGNAGNFLVGQQNGINRTNAFGVNYADNWGTKANIAASYFFNNTNNFTDQVLNRQYFLRSVPNLFQTNINNSRNNNHRVNARLEYRIDSFNQLIITPNISIQQNSSVRDVVTTFYNQTTSSPVSRTSNVNNSDRIGANINNNILYRHSFRKRGRTFSINLNTSYNNRNGEVYTLLDTAVTSTGMNGDSTLRRFTDQTSNGLSVSSSLVYTEPVSENAQLQFSYNPSFSRNNSNQQAYEFDKPSNGYSNFNPQLSSKFDNTTKAQNAGIAYRYSTRDNQFSLGANYQQSQLNSDQEFPLPLKVNKTFNNILPNAMLRLKTSERSNIRMFYRARTNNPSVNQLQDVIDITNLPFVTAGNPELEQQFTHTLSTRYTFTNTQKGLLFVGNVFLESAKDYISNATFIPVRGDSSLANGIVLKSGQQLSKPVNLDGFLSVRSFLTFAVPLKFIKSNFNLNGGVTYNRLPGIINNQQNMSNNMTYTLGSVVASNVSQYVDFTVSYSANFNTVRNELQKQLNQKYFSHVAGLQLNLLSKNGWFFQNDLNQQLYRGLTEGFNQDFFLWNMSVGKKMLKNQLGELKLSVFDLLKQNQSITRNVTDSYIEDEQNQVLQQYFMLTFTYNLRNFGSGPARQAGRGGGGRQF
ncbi:TonB-dependent receptor [Aridibaculum aurantiacum]|uniref:TonB-dependent receptor n=1 Tax=Aridibaculum aurantiacum TaxID=2810307 RepID=UPI001A975960|nr:TonB-dependent receptor [Aridibaculum aurantiacum]